ncbi:hypothetical protein FKM82_023805 [Ascaphus truei]
MNLPSKTSPIYCNPIKLHLLFLFLPLKLMGFFSPKPPPPIILTNSCKRNYSPHLLLKPHTFSGFSSTSSPVITPSIQPHLSPLHEPLVL